jgi:hypothetical protein
MMRLVTTTFVDTVRKVEAAAYLALMPETGM